MGHCCLESKKCQRRSGLFAPRREVVGVIDDAGDSDEGICGVKIVKESRGPAIEPIEDQYRLFSSPIPAWWLVMLGQETSRRGQD